MTRKIVKFQRPTVKSPPSLPQGGLRVLQVSDSHVYADPGGRLVGINTQNSFDDVLSMARADLWPIDLVLATGDLVHDASPTGYTRLRQRFNRLNVPVFCLPGNHDIPDVMVRHLSGGRASAPKLVRRGNWLIVLLDSTVPDEEGGHLNRGELDILAQALEKHSDCFALVCLHHHPIPIGSAWMDSMALDNPEDFFHVLDRHPNVRGVLWGHIHQQFEAERQGVRLMGSPSTCIQFSPRQDDFGIDRLPPGLRWLDLMPDGVIRTGVERLSATPVGLDLRSLGY